MKNTGIVVALLLLTTPVIGAGSADFDARSMSPAQGGLSETTKDFREAAAGIKNIPDAPALRPVLQNPAEKAETSYQYACKVQTRLADPFSSIQEGSMAAELIGKSLTGAATLKINHPLAAVAQLRGKMAKFTLILSNGEQIEGFVDHRAGVGLFFAGVSFKMGAFVDGVMNCTSSGEAS